MDEYSVAEAKARLSELLHDVEAGKNVVITRRGTPVARLVRAKKPLDLARIDAFRRTIPMQKESAADLIRRMRDEKY